jgi:hypothetical protein
MPLARMDTLLDKNMDALKRLKQIVKKYVRDPTHKVTPLRGRRDSNL